jgi:hypothetical protein
MQAKSASCNNPGLSPCCSKLQRRPGFRLFILILLLWFKPRFSPCRISHSWNNPGSVSLLFQIAMTTWLSVLHSHPFSMIKNPYFPCRISHSWNNPVLSPCWSKTQRRPDFWFFILILLLWLKTQIFSMQDKPQLEPASVVSILVSASFLKVLFNFLKRQ